MHGGRRFAGRILRPRPGREPIIAGTPTDEVALVTGDTSGLGEAVVVPKGGPVTAIAVGRMKVHPGKDREYVALMLEWKSLAAKHGLAPRLLVSVLAGPDVGVYSGVYEAADLVALITGFQALSADPAFQSLRERLYGPGGVCTLLSFSQATEIPL